jgi:lipopolysaccharide transport system permease protein
MILVALIYYFYEMPITKMVFLTPIGIISLIILGTFIGLFFAPLGAVVQDFNKGMTVLTTVWLFITPVLFPVPKNGIFAQIVKFNPVTPLLVTTRELATSGIVTDWTSFGLTTFLSIVGLFATWIFFRLAIPYVIERMPS